MRNKIDYGIDLGTTNSAIARMQDGIPTIIKSDTQKDTVPSCVHFNRKGNALVGDLAYNQMRREAVQALKNAATKSNFNSFVEFKRTMGSTVAYQCQNTSRVYSSEELSAEVLKKMKELVIDENFSSVVVTVPAKFLSPQIEATIAAAKMAGFTQVEILQEPVAAATAYGLAKPNWNGYSLVFDFGGGTFDAAIVKAEDGVLSVKDTEGDNWLGGKDIDHAIVDQILMPYLEENYQFSNILRNHGARTMLRNGLKGIAEEIKINLSFKDSWQVLTQLDDLPFEDENGNMPEIETSISQGDMERVAGPIFQKAIDISKGLLDRNNLSGKDIASLILVGGPTHSPILRKMLREQITQKVDTSMDPMTVVAVGAALFASTLSLSEEVKEELRDPGQLQLEIKYEATSVHLDEMLNIRILSYGGGANPEARYFADVERSDRAWSSGKHPIGERPTLIDLILKEGKPNAFEIRIVDDRGNRIPCQPNQFTILQGIGGLDGMQTLPYNIGIVKYFPEKESDRFAPIVGLGKTKSLPAKGEMKELKTRQTLRPGNPHDVIRIPIYQGEYHSEGTNPALNNWICDVVIPGTRLPALLPEGSEVEVKIEVSRSQSMKVTATFPSLGHSEEFEIEIKNAEAPEQEILGKEISKAKRTAARLEIPEVSEQLVILEEQLVNVAGDADGKLKIQDSLRKELLKLEEAEKLGAWPKAEQELKDAYHELDDLIALIKQNGDDEDLDLDKLESHLEEFSQRIEAIIRERNLKQAKELTELLEILDRELRNKVSQGAVDVHRLRYHDMEFDNIQWKDRNKARLLINQGLKMVADGRASQLRPIIHQIWDLRIDEEGPRETLR